MALYSQTLPREEYAWDLAEVPIACLYDGDATKLVAALNGHGCL